MASELSISMDSSRDAATAAAATVSEGRRWQLLRVTKVTAKCVLIANQFVLSCYGVCEEEPQRLRLQVFIALAYPAVVALTLFARWLDVREQLWSP